MKPIATPLLVGGNHGTDLYRGAALAQLRILKQQMQISRLVLGNRSVVLGQIKIGTATVNVVANCEIVFNCETVKILFTPAPTTTSTTTTSTTTTSTTTTSTTTTSTTTTSTTTTSTTTTSTTTTSTTTTSTTTTTTNNPNPHIDIAPGVSTMTEAGRTWIVFSGSGYTLDDVYSVGSFKSYQYAAGQTSVSQLTGGRRTVACSWYGPQTVNRITSNKERISVDIGIENSYCPVRDEGGNIIRYEWMYVTKTSWVRQITIDTYGGFWDSPASWGFGNRVVSTSHVDTGIGDTTIYPYVP